MKTPKKKRSKLKNKIPKKAGVKQEKKKKKAPGKGRDPKNGRFLPGISGNPKGRPLGSGYIDEFKNVLAAKEKAEKKSILEHLIERAFDDDRVLIAVVDRMLPTLKAVEMSGSVGVGMLLEEEAKAIQDELKKNYA